MWTLPFQAWLAPSQYTAAALYDHTTHQRVNWLFLRGLALLYLAAFASMLVQIEGLIGTQGVLPIQEQLAAIVQSHFALPYLYFPTLFWFASADIYLTAACAIGCGAALALLCNRFERSALIACYVLYCSIAVAGQAFTAFQWDCLLLETGFLAILLSYGSKLCVWLYRWLIARFMFMGGIVKIASGDPTWANLTALNYHYQTQPLPSPLGYYAYFLPEWFQQTCVAAVLTIELAIPFLVFLPRPCRLIAAWSFILLQSSILLTGNYAFFNLLTLLLCLFLFDDNDLQKALPAKVYGSIPIHLAQPGRKANACTAVWCGFVLLMNGLSFWVSPLQRELAAPLSTLLQINNAWSLVNNYGPFAVMTTTRLEIIIQGSDDNQQWHDYPFRYKPDARDKPLRWNIPHQPRLDWQFWFASLRAPEVDGWLERLMQRLLEGSPPVLGLFADNPFAQQPPRYVRALLYRYTYIAPDRRTANGQIWVRDYLGELLIARTATGGAHDLF